MFKKRPTDAMEMHAAGHPLDSACVIEPHDQGLDRLGRLGVLGARDCGRGGLLSGVVLVGRLPV